MSKKISQLTEDTSPALADYIEISKASPASRKTLLSRVWDLLTSLTADTPVDADQIAFYDASGSATDKVTLANLVDNWLRSRATTWTNQTLTAPTISDFTNMAHDHGDADDGGQLVPGTIFAAGDKTGTGKAVLDTSPTIVTPTVASLENMNHTHAASGATGGYVAREILVGIARNVNPSDGQTYYFGQPEQAGLTTTAAIRRMYVKSTGGTIKTVRLYLYNNAGTQGSNEQFTIYLRLNNTTDTTLTTTATMDAAANTANYIEVTGLSLAVVRGDYLEFKFVAPTWATNPTGPILIGEALVE